MKMTVKFVKDEPRPWDTRDGGQMHCVSGGFEDGSQFDINCKPENSAARISALKELIGVEGEFGLESKPDYRGMKQWKLVEWPGKPQRPAYGGGGGAPSGGGRAPYQPRYRDTPEGTRSEQDSIHRSVALEHAVVFIGNMEKRLQNTTSNDVIQCADLFYGWLSQGQPPLPTKAPEASSGPPTQPQARPEPSTGYYDPLKEQKEFFGGAPGRSPAVQQYLDEIEKAVKVKDSDRISKLRVMVVDSVNKRKSVTIEEVDTIIEPAIMEAEKALKSSANYDAWYHAQVQRKQSESDGLPF